MNRLLSRLAVVALALALPAGAGARTAGAQTVEVSTGSSSGSFAGVFLGPGGSVVSEQSRPIQIDGALTVTFHGDAATGCAADGLCGYSGSVTWRPPASGQMIIVATRAHHHTSDSVELFLEGNGFPPDTGATSATVQSTAGSPSGAATCLDATATGLALDLPVRHGLVEFGLGGASPALLSDRCAGPRDPQILSPLPAPSLTLAALRRDGTVVDLSTNRPFAADGFAGTIDSTIAIRLGRANRANRPVNVTSNQGTRYAELTVDYRVRASGSLLEHVTGSANPAACGPLGACGVTGTETITTPGATGSGALTLFARTTIPRRRLLAAAGLSGARPPRGVTGTSSVTWDGDGTSQIALGQGANQCRQAAPASRGYALLDASHGRLDVSLLPFDQQPGPPISECPGPEDEAATTLASGELPLRALGRRSVSLVLRTGASFTDDGYSVRTDPDLTLTLTRVATHARTVTFPAGLTPP
jgi:hypothetical protein